MEHIGSETVVFFRAGGYSKLAAKAASFECKSGEEITLEIDNRSLNFFYEGERIGS